MKNVIGILSVLVFGWAGSLNAAVIYTYTGNNFTESNYPGFTTDDFVTANLTLNEALLPDQSAIDLTQLAGFRLKMTAGSDTFIYGQAGMTFVNVPTATTDSSGDISAWSLGLVKAGLSIEPPFSQISTCSALDRDCGDVASQIPSFFDELLEASNSSNPGVWTGPQTVVPIPAAAWLFGSALMGLGIIKRKKA